MEDEGNNPITAAELKSWAARQPYHPIPYPMLLDPTRSEAARKYAFSTGTPMTITVDRRMVIRYQDSGFGSSTGSTIVQHIDELIHQ